MDKFSQKSDLTYQMFAVTPKGLEIVAQSELKNLGASQIEATQGGVYFKGDTKVLYNSNLWLRSASKVLVEIREFSAKTNAMLYDQVRRIHWEEYLTPEMSFKVSCNFSANVLNSLKEEAAELRNSHYVALKIKDSIVDRLRTKFGDRPNVAIKEPDLEIVAYLNQGKCKISLNSSGKSLHERGYRIKVTDAPIKENLAAGILLLSEWDGSGTLMDPMCGSGTFLIEAALTALNVAPGLSKEKFGFQSWKNYDAKLFFNLKKQAQEEMKARADCVLIGYDSSEVAIKSAKLNIERAGLSKWITVEKRDFFDIPESSSNPGVIIMNPPYGERLEVNPRERRIISPVQIKTKEDHGNETEFLEFHKKIGDTLKHKLKGWNAFVFSGNLLLRKQIGLRTSKKWILYNGPIECRLLKYEMH